MRLQQDTSRPGRQLVTGEPARCLLSTVVPDGQVSLVRSYEHLRSASTNTFSLETFLYLRNTAWRLGPTSQGSATIRVGSDERSFLFRRLNDNELYASVPQDEVTRAWMDGIGKAGTTVSVRLPDGQAFTLPNAGQEVGLSWVACLFSLIGTMPDTPSTPRDPFAAPAPAPAQRDPFAPAR